jgi:hypothetical protein
MELARLVLTHSFCRSVSRPHGSAGVVKAKLRSNIPPHAFGASVRVVSLRPCTLATVALTLPVRRCSTPPTSDRVLAVVPYFLSSRPSARSGICIRRFAYTEYDMPRLCHRNTEHGPKRGHWYISTFESCYLSRHSGGSLPSLVALSTHIVGRGVSSPARRDHDLDISRRGESLPSRLASLRSTNKGIRQYI